MSRPLSPQKRARMTRMLLDQIEPIRLKNPRTHAELVDYLVDLSDEARRARAEAAAGGSL